MLLLQSLSPSVKVELRIPFESHSISSEANPGPQMFASSPYLIRSLMIFFLSQIAVRHIILCMLLDRSRSNQTGSWKSLMSFEQQRQSMRRSEWKS